MRYSIIYLMVLHHIQVSMALFGLDFPGSKSVDDHGRRQEIFEIISPYVMSRDDINVVLKTPATVRQLWLESFAMTQKGMLVTKLQKAVKDVGRRYFPSQGGFPRVSCAKAIGLAPSTTILGR